MDEKRRLRKKSDTKQFDATLIVDYGVAGVGGLTLRIIETTTQIIGQLVPVDGHNNISVLSGHGHEIQDPELTFEVSTWACLAAGAAIRSGPRASILGPGSGSEPVSGPAAAQPEPDKKAREPDRYSWRVVKARSLGRTLATDATDRDWELVEAMGVHISGGCCGPTAALLRSIARNANGPELSSNAGPTAILAIDVFDTATNTIRATAALIRVETHNSAESGIISATTAASASDCHRIWTWVLLAVGVTAETASAPTSARATQIAQRYGIPAADTDVVVDTLAAGIAATCLGPATALLVPAYLARSGMRPFGNTLSRLLGACGVSNHSLAEPGYARLVLTDPEHIFALFGMPLGAGVDYVIGADGRPFTDDLVCTVHPLSDPRISYGRVSSNPDQGPCTCGASRTGMRATSPLFWSSPSPLDEHAATPAPKRDVGIACGALLLTPRAYVFATLISSCRGNSDLGPSGSGNSGLFGLRPNPKDRALPLIVGTEARGKQIEQAARTPLLAATCDCVCDSSRKDVRESGPQGALRLPGCDHGCLGPRVGSGPASGVTVIDFAHRLQLSDDALATLICIDAPWRLTPRHAAPVVARLGTLASRVVSAVSAKALTTAVGLLGPWAQSASCPAPKTGSVPPDHRGPGLATATTIPRPEQVDHTMDFLRAIMDAMRATVLRSCPTASQTVRRTAASLIVTIASAAAALLAVYDHVAFCSGGPESVVYVSAHCAGHRLLATSIAETFSVLGCSPPIESFGVFMSDAIVLVSDVLVSDVGDIHNSAVKSAVRHKRTLRTDSLSPPPPLAPAPAARSTLAPAMPEKSRAQSQPQYASSSSSASASAVSLGATEQSWNVSPSAYSGRTTNAPTGALDIASQRSSTLLISYDFMSCISAQLQLHSVSSRK